MLRIAQLLLTLIAVPATAGDKTKAYCKKFEVVFATCGKKCVDYIKQQPEYPKMEKRDLQEALAGCTSICLEGRGHSDQDAVSCDKYR